MTNGQHTMFRLDGTVALVTGGSKGLGKSMAEGLAASGAAVAICSRNSSEAEQVAAEIAAQHGQPTIGLACDVTEPDQVESMVTQISQRLGAIGVLINNAGINIRGPIDELSYDDFRQVQKINVDGVWLVTRAAVPGMKQAGGG